MRGLAGVLLLLAACGSGGTPPPDRKEPSSVPAKTPLPPAMPEAKTIPEALPDRAPLAGLSPSRRRAYERGFADCRAGRYDPDRYPEAYRIGCAAAHDR